MNWELYVTVSVVSLSFSVLLQRVLIHKDKLDPYAYAVSFQGLVALILMTVALVRGFNLPLASNLLAPAAVAVVFFGIGHIVYAKTLQVVEASAFSVFFATQSLWIMVFGLVFLNESLTLLQILGSVLVIGSVGLLVKKSDTLTDKRSIILGLTTGVMFGIAISAFSYVGRFTDPLSWTALAFVATALVALLARPQAFRHIKSVISVELLPKMLLLATLYGLGSYTMLLAYVDGNFSIVTPLRQTSIILTVVLALLFLKNERHSLPKKLLAAVLSTVGVVMIIL